MGSIVIEQDTPQGKALQDAVQIKLRQYLGDHYNDDVLPLYIVVMLAHGNDQSLVTNNLVEFLQQGPAAEFAEWLFKHINENRHVYSQAPQQAPAAAAEAAPAPAALPEPELDSFQEPRLLSDPEPVLKREKIQWSGEAASGHPQAISPNSKRRERERGEGRGDRKRLRGDPLDPPGLPDYRSRPREEPGREREQWDRHREREREHEAWHGSRGGYRDEGPPPRRGDFGRMSHHRPGDYAEPALMEPHPDRHHARDRDLERDRGRDRGRGGNRDWERDRMRSDRVLPRPPAHEEKPRGRENGIINAVPSPPHRASAKILDLAVRDATADTAPDAREAVKARSSVFDRLQEPARKLPMPSDPPVTATQAKELSPKKVPIADRLSQPGSTAVLQPTANGAVQPQAEAQAEAREAGRDVDMQDVGSMRSAMKAMEAQLAQLKAQREAAEAEQARYDSCCVRVSHLPPKVTPASITAHFVRCGRVKSVAVERDEAGDSVGRALVEFQTAFESSMAIALSGSSIGEHKIVVMPKTLPKPSVPAPQPYMPSPRPYAPQPRPPRPSAPFPAPFPGRGMSWHAAPRPGRGLTYVRPGLAPQGSSGPQPSAQASEEIALAALESVPEPVIGTV